MRHLSHILHITETHSDTATQSCIERSVPCVARERAEPLQWPCRVAGGIEHLAPVWGPFRHSVTVPDSSTSAYGSGVQRATSIESYFAQLSGGAGPTAGYLKDWHCCRALTLAGGRLPYTVPAPFADDWLNWYFDALVTDPPACDPGVAALQSRAGDDFRFAYMGPAGSWTPLHHDVLYSSSWSANVIGYKLWLFVSPSASQRSLYAAGHACEGGSAAAAPVQWDLLTGSLLSVREAAALDAYLASVYQGQGQPPVQACDAAVLEALGDATESGARMMCLQGPGDVVFVPGGWHHAVWNLTAPATVSINHNWFTHTDLPHVWEFLARELAAVRAALSDVRSSFGSSLEWEQQCQVILRANAGLNYDEFMALLLGKACAAFRTLGTALPTLFEGSLPVPASSSPAPSALTLPESSEGCVVMQPAEASSSSTAPSLQHADFPVYAAPYARVSRAQAHASLRAIRAVLVDAVTDPYVRCRPPAPAVVPHKPVLSQDELVILRQRLLQERDSESGPVWDWTFVGLVDIVVRIDAVPHASRAYVDGTDPMS
jgi:hypothetical protein